MRIAVHAVGRMKAGPDKELAERYFERFSRTGPALGLEFSGVTEIAESRAQTAAERRREEGQKLRAQLGADVALLLLDERGKNLSSEEFARKIGSMRDEGRRGLVVAIGGADGH